VSVETGFSCASAVWRKRKRATVCGRPRRGSTQHANFLDPQTLRKLRRGGSRDSGGGLPCREKGASGDMMGLSCMEGPLVHLVLSPFVPQHRHGTPRVVEGASRLRGWGLWCTKKGPVLYMEGATGVPDLSSIRPIDTTLAFPGPPPPLEAPPDPRTPVCRERVCVRERVCERERAREREREREREAEIYVDHQTQITAQCRCALSHKRGDQNRELG